MPAVMGAPAVCVGTNIASSSSPQVLGASVRSQNVNGMALRPRIQTGGRCTGATRVRVSRIRAGMESPMAGMGRPGGQWPRLQDLDPSTMLLQQRILFLGSQVDDVSADAIISQMLLLDAQDPTQDIKLFINSPGGSVTAGMGIYDAMKLCKADVSTVCFGLAASMGAFLLAAGTKGKRYCMPNARVMIHQPLGGAGGSAIDVGLQVREMMYHKVKLTKIMARLTGKSEQQIEEDTDRDYFMNSWEAVEYGLVDGVIGDGNPDLVAPIGSVMEPPRSKIWDNWTIKDVKERKLMPSEETLRDAEDREPTAV